jgi:hypothetical protein
MAPRVALAVVAANITDNERKRSLDKSTKFA